MLCCMPTGIVPTPYLNKLYKVLWSACLVQVGLGVLNLAVEAWSGFMMMIGALLLYCSTQSANWCLCVCYIVLSMMDFLSGVLLLGNFYMSAGVLTKKGFFMVLGLLKVPFYIVSIYYAFLCYKELKALYIEKFVGTDMTGAWNFARDSGQRQPFSGQGYRVG